MILCEAYTKKSGSQRAATWSTKSLTVGQDYYSKKTEAFPTIVGYTTFSEYLIVAEVRPAPLVALGRADPVADRARPTGASSPFCAAQ